MAIHQNTAVPTRERSLLVLYGSETGTAQEVAEQVGREAAARGYSARVLPADAFVPYLSQLVSVGTLVLVASTTGTGQVPRCMQGFWKVLCRKSLPPGALSPLRTAVFGLGDSNYAKFNAAARMAAARLTHLGARLVAPVGLGDDQHPAGYDAALDPWLTQLWQHLGEEDGQPSTPGLSSLTAAPSPLPPPSSVPPPSVRSALPTLRYAVRPARLSPREAEAFGRLLPQRALAAARAGVAFRAMQAFATGMPPVMPPMDPDECRRTGTLFNPLAPWTAPPPVALRTRRNVPLTAAGSGGGGAAEAAPEVRHIELELQDMAWGAGDGRAAGSAIDVYGATDPWLASLGLFELRPGGRSAFGDDAGEPGAEGAAGGAGRGAVDRAEKGSAPTGEGDQTPAHVATGAAAPPPSGPAQASTTGEGDRTPAHVATGAAAPPPSGPARDSVSSPDALFDPRTAASVPSSSPPPSLPPHSPWPCGAVLSTLPLPVEADVAAVCARLGIDPDGMYEVSLADPDEAERVGDSVGAGRRDAAASTSSSSSASGSASVCSVAFAPSRTTLVTSGRALVGGAVDVSGRTPSRAWFEVLRHTCSAAATREADRLAVFCSAAGRDELADYAGRERKPLREVLDDFPSTFPTLAWALSAAPRLLPRRYSVASAASFGQTVDLCVKVERRPVPSARRLRTGLFSRTAQRLRPGDALVGWIAPGDLPPAPPGTPLVMISPGVGAAPFRAFVQDKRKRTETERNKETDGNGSAGGEAAPGAAEGIAASPAAPGAPSAASPAAPGARSAAFPGSVLITGSRRRDTDYLYGPEWEAARREGVLDPENGLLLAFSREQGAAEGKEGGPREAGHGGSGEEGARAGGGSGGSGEGRLSSSPSPLLSPSQSSSSVKKTYVQDLVRRHSAFLFDLISRHDARVYVVETKAAMPLAVREAFLEAFEKEGKMSPEEAKAYMRALVAKKRYVVEGWS